MRERERVEKRRDREGDRERACSGWRETDRDPIHWITPPNASQLDDGWESSVVCCVDGRNPGTWTITPVSLDLKLKSKAAIPGALTWDLGFITGS